MTPMFDSTTLARFLETKKLLSFQTDNDYMKWLLQIAESFYIRSSRREQDPDTMGLLIPVTYPPNACSSKVRKIMIPRELVAKNSPNADEKTIAAMRTTARRTKTQQVDPHSAKLIVKTEASPSDADPAPLTSVQSLAEHKNTLCVLCMKLKHLCHCVSFVCQLCAGASFKSADTLKQHIREQHEEGRRHTCQYCSKSFARISHLESHERVHTGVKPYGCDVGDCDRAYYSSQNLYKHQLRVHGCKSAKNSNTNCGASKKESPGKKTQRGRPKRKQRQNTATLSTKSEMTDQKTD